VSDVERRRLAFGDHLRLLRTSAGPSGRHLAEQLRWPASKLSKIETGKQAVTDADVLAISAALGLDDAETEALRDELRAIRVEEARWNRRLRVGHRAVQDMVGRAERDAQHIRSINMNLVPGLLQTAEYARHVFTGLTTLSDSPRDTDDAVAARMERQRILYDPDKRIELLFGETAFRYPIAPAPVMRAQLDRLLAVQGLPALRLGIIPMGRVLPTVVQHDFVIKDDAITIELAHTEMATGEPEDLALYNRLLDLMWPAAVEGEEARALLISLATTVATAAG
jgi:transcriptional regulator with XRE-family HTH domain